MIVNPTEALRSQYRLVMDAYTGQQGFADGSYIFQYAREMDINVRRSMASYTNFIKPIVDARVDPCFVTEASRSYEEDEMIEAFLKNADNNGTPLQQIIHGCVTNTVLVSNDFIVMDSFPENQIPETYKETIEMRKFPYVYTKSVLDVYQYETDIFGKLQSISFYYGIHSQLKDGSYVYLYKRFTPSEIEYFTVSQNKKGVVSRETISLTTHDLGIVPVAYYHKDVLPNPPYYSMATLARKVYNTDSEINDLSRAQMFSILLIPSTNPGNGAQDNIIVSTSNALFYDAMATNKPEFISPDSAIMSVQIENRQKSIDTLIQTADVLGTTAISTGNSATSGIAESYKFFGKQQSLMISSEIAEDLEKQVIDIFQLFVGSNINYEVDYPSNFAPTFGDISQKIATLKDISMLDISDVVTSEMYADIVTLVAEFMQWDDDRVQLALESITEVRQLLDTDNDNE